MLLMLHKKCPIVAQFFKTSLQKVLHRCPDCRGFMFYVNYYCFWLIILRAINNLLAFLFQRYQLRTFWVFEEIYFHSWCFFYFKTELSFISWPVIWCKTFLKTNEKILRILLSVIFEERNWFQKVTSKFKQISVVYLEVSLTSLMELFYENS